jgi:hypothetical protein
MPKGPVLVAPNPAVVLTCLDKVGLYERAGRIGVPTAPWGTAGDIDELEPYNERNPSDIVSLRQRS